MKIVQITGSDHGFYALSESGDVYSYCGVSYATSPTGLLKEIPSSFKKIELKEL